MSIQRWHDDGRCFRDPEGEWVTYADHVAEVQKVRQEWTGRDFIVHAGDPFYEAYCAGRRKGIRDAHESARWCQDGDDMLLAIFGLLDMPPAPPLPPSVGVPEKWRP